MRRVENRSAKYSVTRPRRGQRCVKGASTMPHTHSTWRAVPSASLKKISNGAASFSTNSGSFLVSSLKKRVLSSMIMSPSATASTNFVSNADRGDLYLSSKKLTPALGTWSKKELDLGSILSAFQESRQLRRLPSL